MKTTMKAKPWCSPAASMPVITLAQSREAALEAALEACEAPRGSPG